MGLTYYVKHNLNQHEIHEEIHYYVESYTGLPKGNNSTAKGKKIENNKEEQQRNREAKEAQGKKGPRS